jgi:hypothetical protein
VKPLRIVELVLAAAGIGLGLTSLWTNTTKAGKSGYWSDGTMGWFLLSLLALSALLLAAGVLLRREWPRAAAAGVGAVLLGYFLVVFAIMAPHAGRLDYGGWFGIAGGVLLVAGALPKSSLANLLERSGARSEWLAATSFLTGGGLALGIASIWISIFRSYASVTYWNYPGDVSLGDHSLGIFMLVAVLLAVLLAGGAIVFRRQRLAVPALGASLVFLGLALFYPVVVAFDELGQLGVGAWTAPAGGLLASAALAAALVLEVRASRPAAKSRAGASKRKT